MTARTGRNPTSRSLVTLARIVVGSLLLMIGRYVGLVLRLRPLRRHRTAGVAAGEAPPGTMGRRTAILFKRSHLPKRISFFKEKRITSSRRPGFFKTRLFKALAAAAVVIFGLLVITMPTWASQTFTVTNTNDSGTGSLREAITRANATPNGVLGPDVIEFNIPGTGVQKISLRSFFPDIMDPVIIDGYTQPGASENTLEQGNNAKLRIELDGTGAGDADG